MEEIHRQTLKVLDPRSIDEVLRANDLLSLVLEYDDVMTNHQNVRILFLVFKILNFVQV